MSKCFTDSSCESEHAAPGEMLHAVKGFDLPQGLVCLLDAHWSRAFDRNPRSNRHSLDDFYGYEYVCMESSISELQPFPRQTGKCADPEWKWILYQQQALMSEMLSPVKSMDSFAHTVLGDLEPSLKGDVRKATAELSFASVLCDAPKADELPHLHTGIGKPHRVRMLYSSDAKAVKPTMNPTLSCRVKNIDTTIPQRRQAYAEDHNADPGSQFVAIAFHGDLAHAEKFDLLPLASSWPWKEVGVTEDSCDLPKTVAERNLSVNATSVRKDALDSLTPVCKLLSGFGAPHIIRTNRQDHSVQDRSLCCGDGDETAGLESSKEMCFTVKKHEDEILGEALCRAQTRARLAEKLAAQALQERDWLACLLLKEAWITCTYKHRAQALESENRLLKLRPPRVDVEETQQRASMSRGQKLEQKNLHGPTMRQRKERNSSRSRKERVLLSCTLGLAFVLGLSIAGIGLMIGWSMGRILFP